MREIIDLTKKLIRFKSMPSKPEEIKNCIEFIEKYLINCKAEYSLFNHPRTPSIQVAPSGGFVPILLMTHIDVVDGPDELFNPVEKNQKLYGRGSIDDKYAVALSLVLLKKHLQKLHQEGKNQDTLPFGILITSDEEIGGFNGANKALQDIETNFCIVLDGGSIEKIVVKEKGLVRLKLISRDKEVPGSKPDTKKDAIEKLIDDLIKIKTYFLKSTPEHPYRSVNISNIKSKNSYNRIPRLEASLKIRYTENDPMNAFMTRLHGELHSEIVVEAIEPLFDKIPSSYLKLLLTLSKHTAVGFEDGSNDARFLSKYGIKGIIWGANGNQSQHSMSEHVDIESVYSVYSILDEFMKRCYAKNTKFPN